MTVPHACDQHDPGTTPSCYSMCGCRCGPCTGVGTRYGAAVKAGVTARVDCGTVARQIADLVRAGWSRAAIADEAGIHHATVHRICNREHRRGVNRRVAAAIADVHASLDERPLTIDSGPLVAALRTRLHGRMLSTMTEPDRQAYMRAARTGHVSEKIADRLSVRYLGHPPELVYGCDLQEVAA